MSEVVSEDGIRLTSRMLMELSRLKYAYNSTISGCYEGLINHYGYRIPREGKVVIIAAVCKILSNRTDDDGCEKEIT